MKLKLHSPKTIHKRICYKQIKQSGMNYQFTTNEKSLGKFSTQSEEIGSREAIFFTNDEMWSPILNRC